MEKSTCSVRNFGGINLLIPNSVIMNKKENFYISYNNYDKNLYNGKSTTALVYGNMEDFYVLYGDHRKAYQGKTFQECLEYFNNKDTSEIASISLLKDLEKEMEKN